MARLVYTLLLLIAAPLVPVYLLWRSRRQPEYRQHWAERLGFYGTGLTPGKNSPRFWLHAVSVGETRATQPLVRQLRERWPHCQILITHMTPTGRQTSRDLYGDDVSCVYLPYDWPFSMRRFLRHFQPTMGILLETELWPNLIAACRQQNIPLLLINARLSEKSARGYARFPGLTREALQNLSAIAAQSHQDTTRLKALGASDITLMGNLKFDISPPPELLTLGALWRKQRARRPALLVASSREGEETLIFDAWARQARRDVLLIVVPRHPQRFDAVEALAVARGLRVTRRSSGTEIPAKTDVFLGDSMGEMFAYYASSDVAFMGGSLLDYGCQNLIEACAVGVPVLLGPSTYNFSEAAAAALDCKAAQSITTAEQMIEQALSLIDNAGACERASRAGLSFAAQHRGATQRAMALIELRLPADAVPPANPTPPAP